MARIIRTLLMEPDTADALVVENHLNKATDIDFVTIRVHTIEEALRLLPLDIFDVFLVGTTAESQQHRYLCQHTSSKFQQLPIVILAANETPEIPLETIRDGVQELLFKANYQQGDLIRSILCAIERKGFEARLTHLSDKLTRQEEQMGMPNWLFFQNLLEQAISTAQTQQAVLNPDNPPFILLRINLDNFKTQKQTLGEDLSSLLLIAVAERIRDFFHNKDIVARLHEDGFAVLVTAKTTDGIPYDAIVARFEAFSQSLSAPYIITNNSIQLTCSIGITAYGGAITTPESVLKTADLAAKNASRAGGNCYRFYSKRMNVAASSQIELIRELHQVIDRKELSIVYQPIVNVGTNQVKAAEALLRWQRHNGEFVSPITFIPLAEETGLIHEIGNWVLKNACLQLAMLNSQGTSIRIAVNVSTVQLADPNFVNELQEIITFTNISPNDLELEITENLLMDDFEEQSKRIKQIKDLGVKIGIDDFGTGYSSLGYLSRLTVDKLKIDQSFIKNIIHRKQDQAITKVIIGLAHSLQLEIVAEGVETKEQLDYLKPLLNTEDNIQGTYYSTALPMTELSNFIQSHNAKS